MASETGWRPLRPPERAATARPAPPFARLALTHALVLAGDTLTTLALAGSLFFDISPTAARGRVVLSLVLTMAPFAVVAPLLGPAIDRAERGRRLMVAGAAAGRVVTCAVMAVFLDDLLLFPFAFATLVLSKAHAVAKSALVPAAVTDESQLVEANSKLAVGGGIVGFVAALPGLLVLRFAGGEWVLRLAAVVYLVAAVVALRLHDAPRAATGSGSDAGAGDLDDAVPAPTGTGIFEAAVAMAVLRAVVGFLAFGIAFAFRRDGAASWWFGVALAASVGGGLVGAAVAPRLRGAVREEHMLGGVLLSVGVVASGMIRSAGSRLSAVVLAFAVGLAASAGKLAFDALVQRDAPHGEHGRSFARFEAVFQLTWVLGALAPAALTIPLGSVPAVIAVAALMSAAGYSAARILAGRRPAPAGAVDGETGDDAPAGEDV